MNIPINALFENPDFDLTGLHEADLILGSDVMSQQDFLVYGRDTLEEIARSGEERLLKIVRIELDEETEELEQLIGLVSEIKGKHDYQPG